jgi:hypothetical protein
MRFALAFALALGVAVMSGAAQRFTILTNGRNLQTPINHGLPDKQLGFTFCRLRYENIRRARKSGWGDDYPQADYNFMVRLAELTTTTISRWDNGYPASRTSPRWIPISSGVRTCACRTPPTTTSHLKRPAACTTTW